MLRASVSLPSTQSPGVSGLRGLPVFTRNYGYGALSKGSITIPFSSRTERSTSRTLGFVEAVIRDFAVRIVNVANF